MKDELEYDFEILTKRDKLNDKITFIISVLSFIASIIYIIFFMHNGDEYEYFNEDEQTKDFLIIGIFMAISLLFAFINLHIVDNNKHKTEML